MLLKEIKEIPSSRDDLRKFGLTLGVAFGLIGAWMAWRHHGFYVYFLAAAAFFPAGAFLAPAALKPAQKAWMTLALLMGWVMTRVLLGLLYFLIVTPIGLIVRLGGKKFLDLDFKAKKCSYWQPRQSRPKESYENQF